MLKQYMKHQLVFNKEKLDDRVLSYFKIKSKKKVNLQPWKKITQLVLKTKNSVNIGVIGKYVELKRRL